jgi:hypothetical protein
MGLSALALGVFGSVGIKPSFIILGQEVSSLEFRV